MAYGNNTNLGESPTEGAADLSTDIPYTTAATDFIRTSPIAENLKLQEIDYAATDFLSLKNSLIKYIKAIYPRDFQNFNESDLGMMLIELVAYMGSVLSLKADMLANENFLPTAKNRESVNKLLSLIGYRIRGPISAAANAEFVLSEPTASEYIVIQPDSRTYTTTSPEDGLPLSYTLYKTKDGVMIPSVADSSLTLYSGESADRQAWRNLVLVQGALAVKTGVFENTPGPKTISLTETPLASKSVEVYVDSAVPGVSGAYTEVDNLYQSSGSDSRIFEVRDASLEQASIVFGFGGNGVSPGPNDSYTVSYRVGGGSRGNIGTNALNLATTVTSPLGSLTGNVINTTAGTGGVNSETAEEAKVSAPLNFKRQDRVVSLEDYVSFCNNFVGPYGKVAKSIASTRKSYSSANIIDLYILGIASPLQLEKSSLSYKNALLTALKPKKMMTDEVVVNDGYISTLDLVLSIRIDERLRSREQEIELKVRDYILTYFNVNNREFGESFIPQDLIRALYTIKDIRFATIDNVSETVSIDFNSIIQLNNLIINTIYV
mgnify:CR=1 FL=1|tara:strand:- start:6668 stop:8314 length:1647 start_codon:yes stop_codon:yes gene_type:complete